MIHPSRPVSVEPIRPDVEVFDTDAPTGEIAVAVFWHGRRIARFEFEEAVYTRALALGIVRDVTQGLPPLISLVRDSHVAGEP